MTQPWQADISITLTQAKRCIEQQFPDLAPLKKIQFISEGWDNRVFAVNDTYFFRFPRRKVAVALLAQENKCLPVLQVRLSCAIPNPIYLGQPCAEFPYPFQGYARLAGTTGESLTLIQRQQVLEPFALFLKQLHSIDAQQAFALGVQAAVFDRTYLPQMTANFKQRAEKLRQLNLYPYTLATVQQEIHSIESTYFPSSEFVLVHGDLYFKHLLFQQGQFSGVIDWGDMSISHPVVDYAILWSFFPKSSHTHFFEHYGPVGETMWRYARFLGIYTAITCLIYGYDQSDSTMVHEARAALQRIYT